MRYREIATLPGTPEEAKNLIMDMIAVYQGNDKHEIPITVMMKTLYKQGFDLDRRLLIDLIKDNELINRISNETVYLNTGEDDLELVSQDEGDFSKEKVKQMAKKAINIGGK